MKNFSNHNEEYGIRYLLLLSGLIVMLLIALQDHDISGTTGQEATSFTEISALQQAFLPAKQPVMPDFNSSAAIIDHPGSKAHSEFRLKMIILQHQYVSEFKIRDRIANEIKPAVNRFIPFYRIPTAGQDDVPSIS